MKKLFILLVTCLLFTIVNAQKNVEIISPELPLKYKDTLIIVVNEYNKVRKTKKLFAFEIQDFNWECRNVSFIHYIDKKNRRMDKRFISKKELKKYKTITFNEIKERYKTRCNELQSYLVNPTLYFAYKKECGYMAFETYPLVWSVNVD